jgi:amino acid adenylation domain-containing protein/FkbM family methyltransferase
VSDIIEQVIALPRPKRELLASKLPPLSYAQQRLWFLDQLEPNNPFYNVPTGVRLRGNLNIDALERTLSEIVRRHEVLRTSFIIVAGEARQVIGAVTAIKLPLEDLSQLTVEEREQEAERRASEEAREPFDLSRGPLLRARLLRLAADEHVLLVTMHHIVSDGWSMGVLLREVSALYEAYCAGVESPLPELAIQYADFAVWQRQWLSGAVLEEQLSYWREQLRDLSTLELPTDRVRPAVQSHHGATVGFALGQEETAALKELSRREGATLFMVLLAAFQVLLSRYSGQSEVVVGTDVANREAETARLIGFFVNQLVLRTELSGATSFADVLQRVREVCLGAYAHQDVPFEKLVEELQPERDLSRSPLFQVKLVLQNAPGGALQMGNLRLSRVGRDGQTSKYDLLLVFSESEAGLYGGLEYSTDLFDRSSMERLLEHFQQLLRAVSATPELPLTQVSMLTPAEREQLLREWNQTSRFFTPVLLHELVEEQARQRPEATALRYKDEQLSYDELERRANQLAHHLQRLGVGPEVLVGVCLERTPQMVVALLAVLKAGGAYLPLDPAYPLERLSFMLEDAAVTVLLSELSVLERLPAHWGYTLCLDEEWEQIATESEATPECAAVPENLAYVIYTSGSTGQPKGVMITHQAICNHMQWMQQDLPLAPTDRVLQKTPFSFDASVWEFYAPLQAGAQLVLLPPGQHQDVGQLLESVVRQEITTLQMVPTQLRLLAQAERFAECRSLKRVFSGGEELLTALAEEVVAGSGAELYNLYGPTEASIEVSYYRYDSSTDGARGSVPIGRPIPNTEMYLLDEEWEPVAVGVPGEIYIGGAGLARGYLQRAALTAERFIPDPFSGRAGARLYRTGDEGRYLADGRIEYRGRLDQQVKLRGYRIELGEVETVLGRHQAVAQCAVSVRETESGDQRLVGYVVRELGQQIAVEELRSYLIERLPEYMVPGQWVVLDELPLTASGKVDRKALPGPEQSELVSKQYVGPGTAIEEILAGIWSEVLEVEQVGMHDNFFELGGHSLLATQVVSRTREAFGIEVPLHILFQRGTVSGLAVHIDAALKNDERVTLPPLIAMDHDGEIPLSFAQRRLWFLDQLEPNNPFYNIPAGVRLTGELNLEALERTLSEVVRRHEVLRTSFSTAGGEPQQVIGAPTAIKLPLEDLSHLSVEEREQEAHRLAGEEAREPFDLSSGPLLRPRLLRLAANDHVLLVTIHHIVSDGWSTGILVREVSALYQAYCAGEESPLPELAIQYADFAVWQRQWLSGDVLEEQMSYWREQLRDLNTLELPADRVRPAVQSYRGASMGFALGQEETAALKQLSRREGATLFMVLLAAFQVLLSRYSGQSEVVVGTDIANRNQAETEDLIGFFVNQLVLRTELSGATSFVDVLQRVREVCLQAYAHQDVSFEKLVEELQPERDLSRSPLFQVKFIFQNAPGGTLQMGNLGLSSFGSESWTARFPLGLIMWEEASGQLKGACTYSTDLFEAGTIARLQEHFQQLLRAITAAPELPLTQVSMLTPAEREQLRQWNQTATYFPPVLLHELFERQARQRPEATALRYKDEQLSYDELERRANQLAHHLQRLGVGPEVLVGICLERTPQMVVALLAVLKAGGAYLPLDPAYPLERLSFMLEDAAVTVLLTERELLTRFAPTVEHSVCLDEEWEQIANESETTPECAAVPENLAYVIYTSGSTGQPKGVMITHQAICNHMQWMQQDLPLQPTDRVLQKTPFSFDASVWEFYAPLQAGAQLVLLPPGQHQDVGQLLESVVRQEITTLQMVPTQLRLLAQAERFAECRSLKRVFSGGEELLTALAEEVVAGSGAELYNLYGPTEASIEVSYYRYDSSTDGARGSVPIGRPIPNTEMYLLDEEWEPVAVEVPGEIYIGGAGLARGYLQRAALTAEKFIPDPFSGRAGARLYRTGDEGRYLADGNIEYRGRLDQQVKLRGYRIELGEVETVLGRHQAVAQCAVSVRETESGDQRLVGYVVWELGQEATVAELREYLEERLPEYMVPGQWVVLEELPLTASGKVDRRALPSPDGHGFDELIGEYVGPRTVTEEIVAGIWAEVLEVEQVGMHDNFFELGGHSLLATQAVLRLRSVFEVELPLRSLFESPTVSSLSSRIEELRLADTQNVAPPIVPRQEVDEIPLSFAQQRLWFLDQLEPNNPFYNVSAGVRLTGELNIEALERTLSEVVRRHEVLRTSFSTLAGELRQVIGAAVRIALPIEDLSYLPVEEREQEAKRLAGEEAREPFDLSRGPLLRARLLRLAANDHVLLVSMHHIVSDGWSTGILMREVSALYQAYCAGAESPLTELAIQYADFAVWQRQWLSGDVLEEQMSYWREQLRDLNTLELPTDRARPAVQSYRGASMGFSLGQEETAALKQLSRREGATLFMVLLAAFQVLLSRYSGQSEVVVGTDIANRNHAETEELIGFFVNQLVLRTELNGTTSFVEMLQRVREVCLQAYAHQDVPFEKLVEELQPERDLSRSPLFQVKFIFQNAPGGTLQLGSLRLSSAGGEGRTAKYDLLLALTESSEGIRGIFEYSTDLFDAGTIVRLQEHFQELLRAVTAAPELPLTQISMLTSTEREQLLREWNQTTSFSPARCLHEVFAKQARQPEATALLYEDEQMSYGELERRSNQLAHHLQRLGVGPEVLVGICLERTPQLVVALLAVLKAGGAYLPLDPAYPPERLSFMLEDAAVTVLLSERELLTRLAPEVEHCVCLDEEWEQIAIESETAPECAAVPENLAYVIYTSGSTGQPKGVMITHANVWRLFQATAVQWSCGPADVWALFHSYAFDFSVWELWGALLHGGRLVVVPYWSSRTPAAMLELLREQQVTVLCQTPSAFQQLMQAEGWDSELAVRAVIFGGEALEAERLGEWPEQHAGVQLVNMYGITETTVHVTYSEVGAAEVQRRRAGGVGSVIGRGLADLEVYLLDEELQPVPVGVPGEICIGGAGLGRGYLQRAGLTAARFIPDPFSGRAGDRLYRSGDLARYLADGNIEYQGRLDQQVKVRGFRIELGEIEATLGQYESVAQCVVSLRETESGDKRLVGYVVWESGQEATVTELRQYLSERLPEYMVPGQWVVLDKLPLTASGKVDRRALPTSEQSELTEQYVRPRTATEEIVAGIWAEVLEAEQVGVHDNFFELGGHSLLATQAVLRLRSVFEVELPLRNLFESPTVSRLSSRIEQLRLAGTQNVAPPIVPRQEVDEIPLSFAQQRLWFLDQLEPNNPFYNVSAGVRLSGELNIEALERTLSEVVRRHEVLRTSFSTVAGEPRQVIGAATEIKLPLEDLNHLPLEEREQEAKRRAAEEAREPFDLSRGPLLRARLLRLAADEHVLVVTMHHIVSDGWSTGVLVREVRALYEAYCAGAESPLPELAIQYADFAIWQRQWLSGDVLGEQLNYWREQLRDLNTLELPTDRVRPAVQSYRGASVGFALGQEETAALKQLSRGEGATLFMVLLAAFQVLLSRYSGQSEVVVGTVIANRNYAETEDLMGFFVNQLVLRTELSGATSFVDALQRVREVCLQAYAHQDVPFEKLVEELQPERDLSRSPLFQVAIVIQNTPTEEALDLSNTHLNESIREDVAKYDVLLALNESSAGLLGGCTYRTDLFDRASMERLLEHFRQLLHAVSAEPERPLTQISMLSAAEREQLLREWNETASYFPPVLVHELFAEQACQRPEATALLYKDEQMSYGELERRANQLAHHLQRLGVGPEVMVGICLERRPQMVVALLAVLKAGGAYLPLDPTHPLERLSFMLEDAAVTVLLTEASVMERLPAHWGYTLSLDAEWQQIAIESDAAPECGAVQENLAYVMYTSGSTGLPKGVMITHHSLLNYLCWARDTYHLSEGTGAPLHSSICFDLSVTSLYGPLLGGQCLELLAEGTQSGAELQQALEKQGDYSLVKLTPAHLPLLREQLAGVSLEASARRYILGGENLLWSEMQWWSEVAGESRFYNEYGPTETVVGCCVYEFTAVEAAGGSVPIGRPIANTELYVLDEELEPVPVGVSGEIYIGGAGLARGYLQRAGLTAEKFLPDPFSGRAGARLYRSGDLGRYLADGNIEYRGRLDQQVKVRGFRIELGEIEAVLEQHAAVAQCVVNLRKTESGDKRLVAYVVSNEVADLNGDSKRLYQLPNDLRVVQLNKNETDFTYREIFDDESYLKHGITLNGKDCVFDVGANIGLFTLFIYQRSPKAQVYAFEPIPATFDLLRKNVELYGLNAKCFDYGLFREQATLQFTHYPRMSVMSGAYADAVVDENIARITMGNQDASLSNFADELMADRFTTDSFERQVRTISDVIKEHEVKQIDLLKIDVEKSELDVLKGIDEEDWAKVKQLVVETHDLNGQMDEIMQLLAKHGFRITVEQDPILKDTGIYNVYAVHPSKVKEEPQATQAEQVKPLQTQREFTHSLTERLRSYLAERLPEYMVPAQWVVLDKLPLTTSGKVDRGALPAPEQKESTSDHYLAPRTATEEILAGIWAEVLEVERVGMHDNFFDLGGHSLLATQVISRAREAFEVDLQLRSLFEGPTVSSLGRSIEQLRLTDTQNVAPPIVPRDRTSEEEIPLSFAQQRLWYLDQLEPNNPFYNIPLGVRLSGELNIEALERTLSEIVRRHEVLRTSFIMVPGEPRQMINAATEVKLPIEDLSDLPLEERGQEAHRIAGEEAREPFDLSCGPVLRARLLRLAADDHVLLVTMHHIVSDAWSMGVLIREVSALYEAYCAGVESPLPELAIQYADFAVWQRQWLSGDVLEEQLSYWREQLRDLTTLELPTDRVRPAVQSYRGATVGFALGQEETAALKELSRREGATLFMVLLAAFQVLLSRYSGQSDIAVGSVIANRNRTDTEGLIGFFVNQLVLRTELSGATNFIEVVKRVRETCLQAYAHQDVPFEKLVEELQPERDLSRSPLFQVAFVFQNASAETLQLRNLRLSRFGSESESTKYDLLLALEENDGVISGALGYSTGLFNQERMNSMLGNFKVLLGSIITHPETRPSELEILTEAEKEKEIAKRKEREEANRNRLKAIKRSVSS